MNVLIHRGSNEIGGTCIQLSTERSTILLDLGLPLSNESVTLDVANLKPDAVLISHPHQDHFGLIDWLDPNIPVYIGELGKRLIDATRVLIGKDLHSNNFRHFKSWQPFVIGDFTITPYLVDHSAVDAYGFLIEAEGKRVFYSGDFRAHGRKSVLFEKMVSNPPKDIDLLFMEGTMMQRNNDEFPAETDVERKIFDTINGQENISFLISSSQNIDRIVSAYRACLRAHKTLVIDIYTAWVLEQLKLVSSHIPAMEWDLVKVYTSYSHDNKLKEHPEFFGDFRKRIYKYRVTKEELQANPSHYLFFGKMSHFKIIDLYRGEKPVNVIYSQWQGYLSSSNDDYYGAEAMAAYRNDPQINFVYAHTSGHATVEDLQKFAAALKPRMLVPVHTEHGGKYSRHFQNVVDLIDGKYHKLQSNSNTRKYKMDKKNISTEILIENRLKYMARKVEETNIEINIADYAQRNRYVRICGESVRAVSLLDSYPLCGCVKGSSQSISKINYHFESFEKHSAPYPEHLSKKEERRLQNWIIRESLKSGRSMLLPLNFDENIFDELKFALDEVSLGDKNHPVCQIDGMTWVGDNNAGPNIVRCDILAVGRIGAEIFPVIIELKSNRSMTRLVEQLDNFSRLMTRFEEPFRQLLLACTGMEITNFTPKRMMIWPLPDQRNSPPALRNINTLKNSGIIVGEYNRCVFHTNPVAWSNLYVP